LSAGTLDCLSDGGEFYMWAMQRPVALLKTIPIVKTEKVSYHRGCLFVSFHGLYCSTVS